MSNRFFCADDASQRKWAHFMTMSLCHRRRILIWHLSARWDRLWWQTCPSRSARIQSVYPPGTYHTRHTQSCTTYAYYMWINNSLQTLVQEIFRVRDPASAQGMSLEWVLNREYDPFTCDLCKKKSVKMDGVQLIPPGCRTISVANNLKWQLVIMDGMWCV